MSTTISHTPTIKNYYDDVFDRIENSIKNHLSSDDKIVSLSIENNRLKKEIEDYNTKYKSDIDILNKKLQDYKQELHDTQMDYKNLINQLYRIFTSGIISDVSEDDLDVREYQIMDAIEDKIKKHPKTFNKYFRIFGYKSELKQGFVDNGVEN